MSTHQTVLIYPACSACPERRRGEFVEGEEGLRNNPLGFSTL